MGITTEEEDEITEDFNIENEFPDWQLIGLSNVFV
jgi:hypothetical protein